MATAPRAAGPWAPCPALAPLPLTLCAPGSALGACGPGFGAPGKRGALNGVRTLITPRARSATEVFIARTRPLAIVLVIITACTRFGIAYSAAYRAPPVTFSRPSTRSIGAPTLGARLACRGE